MIALHSAEIGPRHFYERMRQFQLPGARQLKAARRLFLGGDVSLLFENRDTLLYELHEIIRANNSWDPRRIHEEVADYQHLVPVSGTLTTTCILHSGVEERAGNLLRRLAQCPEEVLHIEVGSRRVAARMIPALSAPECPVQHLRFDVGNDLSWQLWERPAAVHLNDEGWHSFPLPRSLRELLAEQLDEYSSQSPGWG